MQKHKTASGRPSQSAAVTTNAVIGKWGNSLAVRLTAGVTHASGIAFDSPVAIYAERGRIVIEAIDKAPTLDEMLASFDPKRHAGEVMVAKSVGLEVL
jgi:antitoxin MazE